MAYSTLEWHIAVSNGIFRMHAVSKQVEDTQKHDGDESTLRWLPSHAEQTPVTCGAHSQISSHKLEQMRPRFRLDDLNLGRSCV